MARPKKEMDIAEWDGLGGQPLPETKHRRNFPPALMGVLGTLALHTLAIQTAFLTSRAYKIRPPEVQEPASANGQSAASPAESLVFIGLPKVTSTDNGVDQALASMRAAMKEHPIPLDVPDPSPPLEVEVLALNDDKPSASSNSGASADRARLFWNLHRSDSGASRAYLAAAPRHPVNEATGDQTASNTGESFQCQAQIVQDATGNVREILLPRCNGTPAWQGSLQFRPSTSLAVARTPEFDRIHSLGHLRFPRSPLRRGQSRG